jgi:hypothetical protein
VRLDDDGLLGEPVELHQALERGRAVHLAAGRTRDRRHVERVIEVRVADEHRVGLVDPARHGLLRGRHDLAAEQLRE